MTHNMVNCWTVSVMCIVVDSMSGISVRACRAGGFIIMYGPLTMGFECKA